MLLWRYLSVETWRLFVDDPRLGLTRIAGFDDAFECSLPMLAAMSPSDPPGYQSADSELVRRFNLAAEQRRNWASCWFGDEHESIAMWQLHVGRSQPGVAIAILHADLLAATPEGAMTAPVHYLRPDDRSAETVIDRPELWPFVKAWGFRHEQEVRLVAPESHPDVVIADSERWTRLASINLRDIVRRCRVLAPNSERELELRREVEAWVPRADVAPSQAYPLVYRGEWRWGMAPGDDWTSRLKGIAPER